MRRSNELLIVCAVVAMMIATRSLIAETSPRPLPNMGVRVALPASITISVPKDNDNEILFDGDGGYGSAWRQAAPPPGDRFEHTRDVVMEYWINNLEPDPENPTIARAPTLEDFPVAGRLPCKKLRARFVKKNGDPVETDIAYLVKTADDTVLVIEWLIQDPALETVLDSAFKTLEPVTLARADTAVNPPDTGTNLLTVSATGVPGADYVASLSETIPALATTPVLTDISGDNSGAGTDSFARVASLSETISLLSTTATLTDLSVTAPARDIDVNDVNIELAVPLNDTGDTRLAAPGSGAEPVPTVNNLAGETTPKDADLSGSRVESIVLHGARSDNSAATAGSGFVLAEPIDADTPVPIKEKLWNDIAAASPPPGGSARAEKKNGVPSLRIRNSIHSNRDWIAAIDMKAIPGSGDAGVAPDHFRLDVELTWLDGSRRSGSGIGARGADGVTIVFLLTADKKQALYLIDREGRWRFFRYAADQASAQIDCPKAAAGELGNAISMDVSGDRLVFKVGDVTVRTVSYQMKRPIVPVLIAGEESTVIFSGLTMTP